MNLDKWINSLSDDEKKNLLVPEIWNAALKAAIEACESVGDHKVDPKSFVGQSYTLSCSACIDQIRELFSKPS
jgi:hypothetical protein